MMRYLAATLAPLVLTCGCSPAPMTHAPPPEAIDNFAVGIEQDGRMLDIAEGSVRLRRAPFAIVLYLPRPDAVWLNASFDSASYDAAAAGAPLRAIPGFARQIREPLGNPDRVLHVRPGAYHNLLVLNPEIRRFDEVSDAKGTLVCRRTVSKLDVAGRRVDVAPEGEPVLYLTFAKADWNADRTARVERHRDRLKLVFGDK